MRMRIPEPRTKSYLADMQSVWTECAGCCARRQTVHSTRRSPSPKEMAPGSTRGLKNHSLRHASHGSCDKRSWQRYSSSLAEQNQDDVLKLSHPGTSSRTKTTSSSRSTLKPLQASESSAAQVKVAIRSVRRRRVREAGSTHLTQQGLVHGPAGA